MRDHGRGGDDVTATCAPTLDLITGGHDPVIRFVFARANMTDLTG